MRSELSSLPYRWGNPCKGKVHKALCLSRPAQRKEVHVHVLTQKSSHRAFKTTGRNGLKCRGKGNGCSRRTSGCASLCHTFSSLPTHIKDKYFQLSEQLIFCCKISENLKYEHCMLISFFSINKLQFSILKGNP